MFLRAELCVPDFYRLGRPSPGNVLGASPFPGSRKVDRLIIMWNFHYSGQLRPKPRSVSEIHWGLLECLNRQKSPNVPRSVIMEAFSGNLGRPPSPAQPGARMCISRYSFHYVFGNIFSNYQTGSEIEYQKSPFRGLGIRTLQMEAVNSFGTRNSSWNQHENLK